MSGYSLVTVFCPPTSITSNEENAVFLYGKRRFLIRKPSFSFAYTSSPRNPRGTNRLSFHLPQCKFIIQILVYISRALSIKLILCICQSCIRIGCIKCVKSLAHRHFLFIHQDKDVSFAISSIINILACSVSISSKI